MPHSSLRAGYECVFRAQVHGNGIINTMVGLQPIKSYLDCYNLIVEIVTHAKAIHAAQAQRWPNHDVRVVTMQNVGDHFLIAGGLVHFLSLVESQQVTPAQFTTLTRLTGDMRAVNGYAQRSVVPMVQFQIEHLMAVLVGTATRSRPSRQFPELAKQFLTAAGSTGVATKVRQLTVASLMRNSLHNNGFHAGETRQCTIDGYTFRFRRGGRVRQASWAHISLAFGASLGIVGEALDSPAFSTGTLIRDRFAASVLRYGQ